MLVHVLLGLRALRRMQKRTVDSRGQRRDATEQISDDIIMEAWAE